MGNIALLWLTEKTGEKNKVKNYVYTHYIVLLVLVFFSGIQLTHTLLKKGWNEYRYFSDPLITKKFAWRLLKKSIFFKDLKKNTWQIFAPKRYRVCKFSLNTLDPPSCILRRSTPLDMYCWITYLFRTVHLTYMTDIRSFPEKSLLVDLSSTYLVSLFNIYKLVRSSSDQQELRSFLLWYVNKMPLIT